MYGGSGISGLSALGGSWSSASPNAHTLTSLSVGLISLLISPGIALYSIC